MLGRDGDCLLVFLASHPFFDVYKRLSLIDKWAPYMKDVDWVIPSSQYRPNPGEFIEKYMMETGFKDYTVEVKEKSFSYEGIKSFKGGCSFIFIEIDKYVHSAPMGFTALQILSWSIM